MEPSKHLFLTYLTVAYGPSDVIINRIAETADDQSGRIRFICSAISFYPSVMFRWNITCESQTDYTHFSVCSMNIIHTADRVVIECTANNTYFPEVFFSTVYDLTIEENKESSAQGVNTAVVGGVGAAAIVLLIIVSSPRCVHHQTTSLQETKVAHFK
ncbi:uncharacterized protein LOC112568927 [Pomacea canaliculata]|uniref:uncharacterized protein LOC112568927 n=1 Tax=Pomacea canaliculata TaxID=400727 RepID=UPI000D7348F6|nr:uncharacterized protein LOC112568927 [Pomacea canaliculata]